MSGPIIGPTGPQFQTPVGSDALGLTPQQTVDTISSIGATFQSADRISLLTYIGTMSAAARTQQQQDREFELSDSLIYRDVHSQAALTASELADKIVRLTQFREDYNAFRETMEDYANEVNSRNRQIRDVFNSGPGPNGLYTRWGLAADAAYYLLTTHTTTEAQSFALINDYLSKRNAYNTQVNQINNLITQYNNYLADQGSFTAEINELNATLQELGVNGVQPLSSFNIQPIPLYELIPTGFPPPYPPNLYFTPGSLLDNLPKAQPWTGEYIPGQVNYLPSPWFDPSGPPAVNITVPHAINQDNFQDLNIDPITELLEILEDLMKRVDNAIVFQAIVRLLFGGATLGEIVALPKKAPPDEKGTVASGVGASLDASNYSPSFDQRFAQSQLDTIYMTQGVPAGSPLIATIDGFAENLIAGIYLKSIQDASAFSEGVRIGATPAESPAVQAGVALAFLEKTLGLVNSDAIFETIKSALLSDPANAGKTEEELATLARGIASALNLEFIKLAVLEVETALGLSGLLPQILANLGSVSADSIIRFVDGLVNYKRLFDSPLDRSLIQLAFNPIGENIVNEALVKLAGQGPFGSDKDVKEALRQTLESLTDNQPLIDRGFERLEAPLAPPEAEYQDLTPQQQLETALKAESFARDLKAELIRSDLDRDEADRIASRVAIAVREPLPFEERIVRAKDLVAREGGDTNLVDKVLTQIQSPLRSIRQAEPIPLTQISTDFESELVRSLTRQGVSEDVAIEQAARYSELFFNSPTSITNLIDQNVIAYSKSVAKEQAEVVRTFFEDSIKPLVSMVAAQERRHSLAHSIVYANNPYYGELGPSTGPGPGVPTNTTATPV